MTKFSSLIIVSIAIVFRFNCFSVNHRSWYEWLIAICVTDRGVADAGGGGVACVGTLPLLKTAGVDPQKFGCFSILFS